MSNATLQEARCDICDIDFDTAEELFAHDCEDIATDGGHVTTREPHDPEEIEHLDAATDHIFMARAAYRGGDTDEGDFGARQAAQHLEAVFDGGER